jgi:cell division septation protein DedD
VPGCYDLEMEQKQRLFIYDRREVVTLVALGLMVAAFAFTLGVHLGKRVIAHSGNNAELTDASQIPTMQDSVPNKQELKEQSKDAQDAADQELSRSLKEEVTQSGVKLKASRQVELPTKTKSKEGGATTLNAPDKTDVQSLQKLGKTLNPEADQKLPEKTLSEPSGKYTLQVGSYPTEEEAKERVDSLREHGLNPFLRQAEVKGLGLRYRLFVGGFASREEAEKSGKQYQAQHVINSFLVSNLGS